jgi:hypothetical protein
MISVAVAVVLSFAENAAFSDHATAQTDSTNASSAAYIYAGFSGFIPFRQSYHLNYTTKLGGLPIEVSGGLGFPLNRSTWFPLTIRYIHRQATYVSNLELHTISIEPGVRVYLEKFQENELRFFGGASVILARTTLAAVIDASRDGSITGQQAAQHDYLNFGLGVDLGLSYPVTATSLIDGGVHLGILVANPVLSGGLGNVGGVSIGIDYRIGF